MNNTIGQRILMLRKEKNLTQAELAELLSVSGQAVSKWEQDRSYPDILLLPTLSKILGVTVDELLTGEILDAPATVPENDSHADRVMSVSIVKSDYVKDFHLPLDLIEGVVSLASYFPEEVFQQMQSELEQAILLAKRGAMGEVFSLVCEQPTTTVIDIEVKNIDEIGEE